MARIAFFVSLSPVYANAISFERVYFCFVLFFVLFFFLPIAHNTNMKNNVSVLKFPFYSR